MDTEMEDGERESRAVGKKNRGRRGQKRDKKGGEEQKRVAKTQAKMEGAEMNGEGRPHITRSAGRVSAVGHWLSPS